MRRCEHGSTAIHCPQCIARHLGIDHPPRKQTFDIPKVLSNAGLREIVKEQQATITEQAAKIAELEAIIKASQEQEPVAWMYEPTDKAHRLLTREVGFYKPTCKPDWVILPLYAVPVIKEQP